MVRPPIVTFWFQLQSPLPFSRQRCQFQRLPMQIQLTGQAQNGYGAGPSDYENKHCNENVSFQLTAIVIGFIEHAVAVPGMVAISVTFVLLPWIFIPFYAIYSMYQSVGTIGKRFQHCCRPNDWYPVEAEERQRYEVEMGNTDVTHHLSAVTEDL